MSGIWTAESEVGSAANPTVVSTITNPVAISGVVPVSTQCAILTASFARPGAGDVTAYAVNDAVANSTSAPVILTFANAARANGGSGYIVKAELCTDQAACTAAFRLHLFTTSVTPVNDNAAYLSQWVNRAVRVGHLDFLTVSQEGTGSTSAFCLWSGAPLLYVCDAADTALYGLLETKSVFTPASGQNFSIKLGVDKN